MKRRPVLHWTPEEDEILQRNWFSCTIAELQADLRDRCYEAIRCRARLLSLPPKKRGGHVNRRAVMDNDKRNALIIEMFKAQPISRIARHFNLAPKTIELILVRAKVSLKDKIPEPDDMISQEVAAEFPEFMPPPTVKVLIPIVRVPVAMESPKSGRVHERDNWFGEQEARRDVRCICGKPGSVFCAEHRSLLIEEEVL